MMDNELSTDMRVTTCSINHTMQTSPCALTFQRDMFVDVPIVLYLIAIQNQKNY